MPKAPSLKYVLQLPTKYRHALAGDSETIPKDSYIIMFPKGIGVNPPINISHVYTTALIRTQPRFIFWYQNQVHRGEHRKVILDQV